MNTFILGNSKESMWTAHNCLESWQPSTTQGILNPTSVGSRGVTCFSRARRRFGTLTSYNIHGTTLWLLKLNTVFTDYSSDLFFTQDMKIIDYAPIYASKLSMLSLMIVGMAPHSFYSTCSSPSSSPLLLLLLLLL